MAADGKPIEVALAARGARLDHYLAAQLTGVSRKKIKQALDRGEILVDGRVATRAGLILQGGEAILTSLRPTAPQTDAPTLSSSAILYRDAHLLALNKPAGVSSHRTSGGGPDALSWLGALLADNGQPPILLHRLDTDTSGVLLFALSELGNRGAARQFAARTLHKTYLALVAGEPPAAFSVSNHLRVNPRGRSQAVRSGGQLAETEFRTLAQGLGFALVQAWPRTGRTHQIRAHLSGQGYPLLGDILYGGPAAVPAHPEMLVRRHLLHAWRLELQHPLDFRPLCIEAEPPEDFQRVAALLL